MSLEPYWQDEDGQVRLHLGDCLDVLPTIPDVSIDAVICDPPYNLPGGFMGKDWDNIGPAREFQAWCQAWATECLRVLKPGGHLLAFGSPRTYHRLAAGIEDAGFEIRDSIHWTHGNGFPKGIDVAKAIDRAGGASPTQQAAVLKAARERAGMSMREVADAIGCTVTSVHDWEDGRARAAGREVEHIVPSPQYRQRLADLLGYSADERRIVGAADRASKDGEVFQLGYTGVAYAVASTDAASPWAGWNTALRPAHEPIVVARKALAGTVASNVLEHGTGALNIAACRTTVTDPQYARNAAGDRGHDQNRSRQSDYRITAGHSSDLGRWPTNVVLCHGPECVQTGTRTVRNPSGSVTGEEPSALVDAVYADRKRVPYVARETETVAVWVCQPGCPVAEMDRQSGVTTSSGGAGPASGRPGQSVYGTYGQRQGSNAGGLGDSGGASRFFPTFRYEAKAPASERPRLADGTAHATVKPLELMRWLVRLVTPPGGTILDPFAGSGTSGEAAALEGFGAVLIERERQYADLCVARLSKPLQPTLFGDLGGAA